MSHLLSLFLSFLKSISVEPPVLLCCISTNIYAIVSDLGMYRVICDKFFNSNGGTNLNGHKYFECWNKSQSLGADLGGNGSEWWLEAETQIQQQATSYSMIVTIVNTIPSMISNIILSAYGDRRGRKSVLLIGYLGIVIVLIPAPIFFAYPKTIPLYTTFIFIAVAAWTGSWGIIMSSNAAYLTDTVRDPELLTLRMSIIQISMYIGYVVGPVIGTVLLSAFGFTATMIVPLILSSLVCLMAIFMVKQIKPENRIHAASISDGSKSDEISEKDPKSKKSIDISANSEKSDDNTKNNCGQEIVEVIKEVPHFLADSFRTIFKKRDGHKRAYIFVVAIILFIFSSVDATFNGTFFNLYVQKEPLNWTQDKISYYRSVSNLIGLIGASAGILIFKKVLHMSDSAIVFSSLASMTGQGILITLSSSSWMLYLAAGVGTFASLSTPCLQALVAKIMAPNEIGKAYGAFSLTNSLSYFFSSVVIGAIYYATVAFYPAMVFLVATIMLILAMILAGWLHVDFHRASIGGYLKRWYLCCRDKDMYRVQ